MSTLRTTTVANLTSLGATSNVGDTYFETDNKKIVVWDGSAWTTYNNDGIAAPYSNAYSVYYDGVGDYSTLGSTISFSGEFTISTWLNFGTLSGSLQVFFGEVGSYIYMMYNGANSSIYFVPAAGQTAIFTSVSSWNTSEWHHFMVTRNSSNTITLYLDGSSAQTGTNSNTLQFRSFGQSNYYYTGYIDEYAVWDSDQSANIGDIRDSSLGAPKNLDDMSTAPLHWWRMGDSDSGSGTTITDIGSAATTVDATLVNSVISSAESA